MLKLCLIRAPRFLLGGAMALTAACGGKTEGDGLSTDGGTSEDGGSSIAGKCETDRDCLAVLDYRDGFFCWVPKASSLADVMRDPCLVPYRPNPRCTTAAPPSDCPYTGPIPVTHSCFAVPPCMSNTCVEGKCSLDIDYIGCQFDAGPIDCEALRQTLVSAIATAQACDPAEASSTCRGSYADTCGCEVPVNLSGPDGNAVDCAFQAWSNAGCRIVDCGKTCIRPTPAGAVCVPNASGTTGTCAWKTAEP
jgi:hypothetical protein